MKNEELTQMYRSLDQDLTHLYDQLNSRRDFEEILFLPTDENVAQARADWQTLKDRAEALDAPDPVYALLKNHFQDFLDSLQFTIDGAEASPAGAMLNYVSWLQEIIRCDRRPDSVRRDLLQHRLEAFGEYQDIYSELIQTRNADSLNALSRSLLRTKADVEREISYLKSYFPDMADDELAPLNQAMSDFCTQLTAMAGDIGNASEEAQADALKDDLSIRVALPKEAYRNLLKKRLGVSLDELLSWYQEEVVKTRAEVFRIAADLNIEETAPTTMKEVSDILFRYAGPCSSAEEMFDRANYYLKRTRAVAHEYVRLPEDEACVCVPLPEFFKDGYPWGGYEGGDFSIRPFRGQMFLNQYNYNNITDGWIKLNAMHESYPGHHVQYVRSAIDATPDTVKLGAKNVPILEGTCLRTERAFQFIFAEDPFFPLFVAFRRHHTSVRILVDLQLFYFGATLEEAIQIYEKELGFDRVTARTQVRAHQSSPGYFTCYYYGMKKLCDWEKEYGYTKWDYTELLFSAGQISMESLGMLVRMTKEEQERYFHEFGSSRLINPRF